MTSEDYSFPENLLPTLLAVSLTAVNLLRPLYGPEGEEIVDFFLDYLNPAAQRTTGLPERPQQTALTRFPDLAGNGVLDFYRRTYQHGGADTFQLNYQADGLDNFFRIGAQRCGPVLVVSFTDTSDQPRTPVEEALRDSQARERQARAEVERERALLRQILSQAPAYVATFSGPDHVYSFFNEEFARVLTQNRVRAGVAFAELFPELVEQGFQAVLDQVYTSGQAFTLNESKVVQRDPATGQERTNYVNVNYQPLRDEQGQTHGLLAFATDVTEQVLVRQQVQELNEELATINEELRAANDEFLASNAALGHAEQHLQHLNQELEVRVQARTQELVQAQAETNTQRQRLHQLVAEAPALIAVLRGAEHVVELANEGFRAIFGWRELVGKSYREAIPEFASQPFFDRLDRVYRMGETYYGIDEPVILDRTNSGQLERTFITYTYQATRDAQGQIDGILVFCYEVTEQVLARQERDQQRQRLHDLFMQAPAAICILDGPELVYELVNPGYQALFPGRQLHGRPLLDALPEIADHTVYQTFRQVYNTGTSWQEQSMLVPLARPVDGVLEDRYFNYIQQARRDAQGKPDGVLVFAFEVTEQVRARQQVQELNEELATINEELTATNEELHESNTQLSRTNADLDTFVYAASHDLKAPIANIEGLLDVLREYLPSDDEQPMVPQLVTMMQGAIRRFQQTVAHLTDVSRLQHTAQSEGVEVYVPGLLEDVRLDLQPLLDSTQAQLHTDIDTCPRVHLPAKNMRSILFNLLSNALKYRAPGRPPVVYVRTQCTATQFVLSVQDNGLGLSDDQQQQLFTMFRRLHTHVEGSGVGLYLIKRMIELAGGSIAVYSQLGVGSTFTVTLPRLERR